MLGDHISQVISQFLDLRFPRGNPPPPVNPLFAHRYAGEVLLGEGLATPKLIDESLSLDTGLPSLSLEVTERKVVDDPKQAAIAFDGEVMINWPGPQEIEGYRLLPIRVESRATPAGKERVLHLILTSPVKNGNGPMAHLTAPDEHRTENILNFINNYLNMPAYDDCEFHICNKQSWENFLRVHEPEGRARFPPNILPPRPPEG